MKYTNIYLFLLIHLFFFSKNLYSQINKNLIIYTIDSLELKTCQYKILKNKNIVFKIGDINKVEKNYSVFHIIDSLYSRRWRKILYKDIELNCSNNWKNKRKELVQNDTISNGYFGHKIIKYRDIGLIKTEIVVSYESVIDASRKITKIYRYNKKGILRYKTVKKGRYKSCMREL